MHARTLSRAHTHTHTCACVVGCHAHTSSAHHLLQVRPAVRAGGRRPLAVDAAGGAGRRRRGRTRTTAARGQPATCRRGTCNPGLRHGSGIVPTTPAAPHLTHDPIPVHPCTHPPPTHPPTQVEFADVVILNKADVLAARPEAVCGRGGAGGECTCVRVCFYAGLCAHASVPAPLFLRQLPCAEPPQTAACAPTPMAVSPGADAPAPRAAPAQRTRAHP
jgi:hypothetical protein